MVTSIADLSPAGITVYPGDYDEYLVEREARKQLLEAQARNQAKRIAEIERFIDRFRYQATKARQVQSRIKMLDKVERIELDGVTRRIHFAFPEPPRTGRRVASLRDIHKSYGSNVVYSGMEFEVERGDRVALVGENGAGKSTLLKILAGALPFDRGERTLGPHVAVHYYAQHQLDALTAGNTVLEEIIAAAPHMPHTRLRAILGAFLFSGDSVEKKVTVLSGGEKARLALAKMLVRPAALLCLDEPTNHLDLGSREVLEDALAVFPGTIVFISHDRYFINAIATSIIEVAHGTLTRYLGSYDDYLSAKASPSSAIPAFAAPTRAPAPPPKLSKTSVERERPAPRPAAPERVPAPAPAPAAPRARLIKKAPSAEVRALRKRVEEVEKKIQALEARLEEISTALSDPALYTDGDRVRAVSSERKSAEEQMTWLMREWESLSTELAAHG
jgi:ATP-binding cassette subfamily F protein 3